MTPGTVSPVRRFAFPCKGAWPCVVERVRIVVAVAIALFAQFLIAAPKATEDLPPRLDASINNGMAFLVKQQNPDGSFDTGGPKVAATGLSVLAYLSAGNAPDMGRYGLSLRNAIDWLLTKQAADGYFGEGDRGMYTHAIVTLALTQAYGLEPDAARRIRMHTVLARAVAVILAAQNVSKSNPAHAGGWRYEKTSADSDLSLSGWNCMALRGADAVGIEVPADARKRAVDFILRCFDGKRMGFGYQPGNDAQTGETGIGVLCLYLLNAVDVVGGARMDAAAKYLESHPIDDNSPFPCYGSYFVAQAAFQRDGETWSRAGRPTLDRLIRLQDKDGGWPQSKAAQEPGRIYATAMAVQSLTVPYRLLPVYQR